MAAATISNSYVLPLGPVKIEIAHLTSVNDADTYVSTIQNPSFGFAVANSDATPMTAAIEPSISGRTVTINSVDLAGSNDDIVLVLVGF